MNKSSGAGRLPPILLLTGVLLLAAWSISKGIRIAGAVRSLSEAETEARALMRGGLGDAEPREIQSLAMQVRSDVLTLKEETSFFVQVAPALGWLPAVGPLLEASPELLEIADAGSEAGLQGATVLGRFLSLHEGSETSSASLLPKLATAAKESEAELTRASQALDRAVAARGRIQHVEQLPARLRNLIHQLDANLPLAQDGLLLLRVFPAIVGDVGMRRYLLIAQNEDEIRPTGGFISGAGLVELEDGDLRALSFVDANLVDDWQNKPYGLPPQAFNDIMGMDIFLFRDANFWPDFPTSAEVAMELYTHGQEVSLDGAIAFDQEFVRLLVEALGQLYVPDLDMTVTSENVKEQLRLAWRPSTDSPPDWWRRRKDFMGQLANGFLERVESDLGDFDPLRLARAVATAANQRHLQIYVRDAAVASALVKAGWDGRLISSSVGDTLAVIDTNLGFNKVGPRINRQLAYRVEVHEDGGGLAELLLRYTNLSSQPELDCVHGAPYTGETLYGDLLDDCYWDFLRVYAPAGSRLIDGSRHQVPGEALLSGRSWDGYARELQDEPGELAVFANFLLLGQKQELEARFDYELPVQVIQVEPNGLATYRLTVRKQAGTLADPLTVTVILPPSAKLVTANPVPATSNGREITFRASLLTDVAFTVVFR